MKDYLKSNLKHKRMAKGYFKLKRVNLEYMEER